MQKKGLLGHCLVFGAPGLIVEFGGTAIGGQNSPNRNKSGDCYCKTCMGSKDLVTW